MYGNLLSYVYNRVYDNGNYEITPTKMRQCFQEVKDELGLDANFMGFVVPSDIIPATDVKQMYIALPTSNSRTFTNFGGSFSIPAYTAGLFYYTNDQWNCEVLDFTPPQGSETQAGIVQLATSAEAIAGTDDEKVLTPETNRDAHDAWHWFGTQAQFDALAPDYDPNVIYHVETTDDNAGFEFHELTYAATMNFNIGTQPTYSICKCTGDVQINIVNLGNTRENHIVLYSEVSDTGYHQVNLNTAPTGLSLIGELKPLPLNNSNPFYGQPNITQCFVQGVDICIIKVGSNMVVTWSFLGYKS